jgi:membrane protease YdiL (CAAX protease family)
MEHESLTVPPSVPSFPDPPRPNRNSNIFLNEDGLRAGWRFSLYLAGAVILFLVFRLLLGPFWRSASSFSSQFMSEVIGFAAAFGAALLMALLERRSVDVYGLPVSSAFGKRFWQGYLVGLLEISLLIGLIAAFHGYSFGSLALHRTDILRWAALWTLCMVFVALFEEFLFRGYSLYTLTSGIGFWPASIVLSLLFGAVHWQNSGEGLIGVSSVVVVALLFCFTVKRTGNLWFAVGLHAAHDVGETFVYSVPDSGVVFPGHLSDAVLKGPSWLTGGTVGPEASLFEFVIFFVLFYVVHRLFPAKDAPGADLAAVQRTSSDANTNLTP